MSLPSTFDFFGEELVFFGKHPIQKNIVPSNIFFSWVMRSFYIERGSISLTIITISEKKNGPMGEILTHSVFLTMKSRPPQLSFPTLNFFNNSSSKTRYAVRKRTTSVWKPMTLPQLYSETNSADFVKF